MYFSKLAAIAAVLVGVIIPAYAVHDIKGDNATIKVVKAPKRVKPGEQFELAFDVKNPGVTTHRRLEHYYALGIGDHGRLKHNPKTIQVVWQPEPDLPDSDHNRIMLGGSDKVKPDQTHRYRAKFSHTAKPGETLQIDAQMVIEGGRAQGWPDGWFGQMVTVTIPVVK